MIDETIPFPLDFPLYELPNLPDEVLFAFHVELRKFIYLNVAFEKVWQIPRASIMSDLSILINTVHEDDRTHVRDAFTALQKDKQKQTVEFRIQSPGEEQKWIKLNGYVLKKGNTEVVVGIATDFSAERNYSETLHKFNHKKNSILQILSHDLLGPLGNIEVSTHLLSENSMVNADESVMKIVNLISKSSQRSITMIRDLITAEFLQTAESAFVKQRVDLVEKVTVMIDQFQQSPRSIQQRFVFTTSCDSLFISIDEAKFMQAINNLLSNALKFTPDDGSIEIRITEPDDKNVLITIQDNGIGIPADMQPFLFDKFTKARRVGIHGEPTNGLGMSIIKTIVEWHNGRIWFESTEGKGSTFYVEIPKDK